MPDYFFKIGSKSIVISKLKEFLNSCTYLKAKNNRTDIFDSGFQGSLAEYQKYHNLKISDGSLNEETYSQIGKELTDVQIDIMSLNQPELKKLLYGVGLTDICAEWETVSTIIPKDKFIGWAYNFPKIPKVCFRYSWEQIKIMGHDLKSPGWGTPAKINPHIYQIHLTEDVGGMKKSELAQQFTEGILYLKKAIKSKTPVMVGIDDAEDLRLNKKTKKYEVHHDNTDRVTDHFVTIVGMGTDTLGKYFLFYDNATGIIEVGTSDKNRLYCDCANFTLAGNADPANAYAQGGYGKYTVTQIRESK